MLTCYKPLRIKNQYTGDYLHVPCRSCPACLISAANLKSYELSTTLAQYKYCHFLTLTYDNDNVPYILEGYNYIFRGQGIEDFPDVLDVIPELINWNDSYKYLTNHANNRAIGVLYYRDVQLFLKRFRKYIKKHYGNRKFKYFVVGEYGTFYGRPHYHVVIFSDGLTLEECKTAAMECWKMHDWSRFRKDGINEACKRCSKDCASYISSYVNCNVNNLKISLYKTFSQKTFRSKNIDFGLDGKLLALYKEDVVRIFEGFCENGNREVFYYLDNSRVDNVSFRLFPSRYLFTCFSKFKKWSKLSLCDKLSRSRNIIEGCQRLKGLGLPLDTPINGVSFSSMDLSFYRAFCRFKKMFLKLSLDDDFKPFYTFNGCEFDIYDYVVLMDKVLLLYNCKLLKEQMKIFEKIGSDNYFLSLIDTGVDDGRQGERLRQTLPYISLELRNRITIDFDLNCPPYKRGELDAMCEKYKRRLLPKHLNDVSNILSYY